MMNWLFSRPKNNLPEPTALQTQRAKQIDQLKTFNQNISEIHRDVEYRVNFIVTGLSLSMYITLPPQFPQERPSVRISPPVSHSWVNDLQIVTGCHGLNNFVVHSDLGKVIRTIVEEFQKNPPVMLPQQSYAPCGLPYPVQSGPPQPPRPPMPGYTPYPGISVPTPTYMAGVPAPGVDTASPSQTMPIPLPSASYQVPGQATLLTSPPGASAYKMPDLPATFPGLHDLSIQELQQLSEDEDRILEILRGLPHLETISQNRKELCDETESLAKQNVSKKPILEESKRILLEKYDKLNDLRQSFEEKAKGQESLRQKFDPLVLQGNLKVAAMQAEEESETIAESFLDGKITVDEFHKKYMEKRKLSYLRKAKEEKLTQYIMRGDF